MTEKKRYIVSDFFWEVLDTKYDWFGNTEPFSKEVIEEEDYLYIGKAKTQEDGEKICNLLNKLAEENEQLKYGNKNLKAVLNDFISICNKLQSNPNNKQTVGVARDMLQNMGVELK